MSQVNINNLPLEEAIKEHKIRNFNLSEEVMVAQQQVNTLNGCLTEIAKQTDLIRPDNTYDPVEVTKAAVEALKLADAS